MGDAGDTYGRSDKSEDFWIVVFQGRILAVLLLKMDRTRFMSQSSHLFLMSLRCN